MRDAIKRPAFRQVVIAALILGAACSAEFGSDGQGSPGRASDAGASDQGGPGHGGDDGEGAKGGGAPVGSADAGASSDASNMGGARSGGSGTGGAGGAAGMPAQVCNVVVTPVNTNNLSSVPGGPGEILRLRGRLTGNFVPDNLQWDWRITHMLTDIQETPDSADPSLIEFPVTTEGRYEINVSVHPLCKGFTTALAISRDKRDAFYYVRVIPPRESGLPPLDAQIQVVAGNPVVRNFPLASGVALQLDPRTPGNTALPSYLRLQAPESTYSFEGESSQIGPYRVTVPFRTYDLLIVPAGKTAPMLFTEQGTGQIALLPLMLTPGIQVSGVMRDAQGPISGARILLRAGGLPSTLGQSDSVGAYTVLTRPGSFTARVVPPAGSNLPVLQLPPPGIQIPADAPLGVNADVTWNDLPTARLSLIIRTPAGLPASGTRVIVTPVQPLANAGSLIALSGPSVGTPLVATGELQMEAIASAAGTVGFAGLPRAPYLIRMVPPAGFGDLAETRTQLDLSAGDVLDQPLRLVDKLRITGTLAPMAVAAGFRLTAHDTEARSPGTVTSALAAQDGRFELRLDPQKKYLLLAEPPHDREATLPRTPLGVLETGMADAVVNLRALPAGLPFSGRVLHPNATPVVGAVLQVFCMDASPGCIDFSRPAIEGATPLAESISDGSGAFKMMVPDPGSG